MDPIKVDFTGGKSDGGAKPVVVAPSKAGLRIVLNLVITLVVAAIAYYIMLPPLNFKSTELYTFLGLIFVVYGAAAFLTSGAFKSPDMLPYVKKQALIPVILIGVLVVIVLLGQVFSSVIFRAKSYQALLPVAQKNFTEDIEEADFNTVPVLDIYSVQMLGDRQLNALTDYISQFQVNDLGYTQINYQGRPVRVTNLQYADLIKWFTNRKEGLPAYVMIDLVTQKAEIVRLSEGEGMKYSPAEHFGRLLSRHLRFTYPTYLFDTPKFEVDESGKPFWIVPRLDKTIGLFGGTDVRGIIMVDPVTGACEEYTMEDIKTDPALQWIDNVYSDTLLTQQFNYYGKYKNGFINSLIGQRDVKVTTMGNNFLAINDDVYFYTGVTSVTSDQSIVGFTLINKRTKESAFYTQAGAQESSAQQSAQGALQQFGYQASFPLLLNISGQPTYFMSMKDSSQLVKSYAMVNVEQYSVGVATGSSIKECTDNYVKLLRQNGIQIGDVVIDEDLGRQPDGSDQQKPNTQEVTGKIADIRTAVKDGNSYYYLRLQDSDVFYVISASANQLVVTLNVGDTVKLVVPTGEGSIVDASEIDRATA